MGLILFCTSLAWIAKHICTVTNYVREHILQFSRGLQKNKCPCLPLIFVPAENKYNYLIMGSMEIKVVLYQTSERGSMLNGWKLQFKCFLYQHTFLYANVASCLFIGTRIQVRIHLHLFSSCGL